MSINFIYLIVSCLIIMSVSLSGVFFTFKKLGHWTEKNINYLLAFASGVFLVLVYNLIHEGLELSNDKSVFFISIIAGFLVFSMIEKMYPEIHCHHDDKVCISDNSKRGAHKVLIGDVFHNIGDGILLAPIFFLDISLGFVAAFGVLVHEVVQEIAEFFVYKKAGYSNKKALTLNVVSSSSIVVGAVIGYFVVTSSSVVGPLIGLSTGIIMHILIFDLLPSSFRHSAKEKKLAHFFLWLLVGFMMILAVDLFTGSH